MSSDRTSSAAHIRWRDRVLARARAAGQTECPLCGVALSWGESGLPTSVEADHIIPWSRGGLNDLDNGQAICRTCNRSKGDRDTPHMRYERQTVSHLLQW